MTKTEEKVINFIRNNIVYIVLGAVTILGLVIRYYNRDFVSGDAKFYLLPWYDKIDARGFRGLAKQVGNYNILYQFIIYIFTLLPIKALYAYKLLSVFFDYALAVVAALIVTSGGFGNFEDRVKSFQFITVYSGVVISPLVFMNSSCWAQCDSIYVFFIFAALYAFINKKYFWMFVLYGLAFAFKFQAVLALPFFLILYVAEKKYSVLNFLILPVILVISSLPGIFMGRSLLDPFRIYSKQTVTYNAVSMNYHSFWNLMVKGTKAYKNLNYYPEFKMTAIVFTVVILGLITLWILKNKVKFDAGKLIGLLHITAYTCVLFLPTMHDRYGYIYEITAIMLMMSDKKYFFPGIGLTLLSCVSYGRFLYGIKYSPILFASLNVLLYCWYVYQFITENSALQENKLQAGAEAET